jgi:hypothetical protein
MRNTYFSRKNFKEEGCGLVLDGIFTSYNVWGCVL